MKNWSIFSVTVRSVHRIGPGITHSIVAAMNATREPKCGFASRYSSGTVIAPSTALRTSAATACQPVMR